MADRAIILVPGFEKREQLDARDMLVDAICAYAEGYQTATSDALQEEGFNSVKVTARNRQTDEEISLNVYEAYWGDLVPDWSGESPWARFKRGLSLVFYWFLGGLAKSIGRQEWPARTLVAIIIAGILMLIWYLVVIALLIRAYAEADAAVPAFVTSTVGALGLTEQLSEAVNKINAAPVLLFLVGLAGLGILEKMSNLAAFTKAYLQDSTIGRGSVGLRGKARTRVRAVLDHVHSKGYDEVYVVAHSFGGAIAVDALAEYGKPLSKTVLHTWGTAMGVLVQQEPLIEIEIGKFYTSSTRISNWIDVVFGKDIMGSKVPLPYRYDGKKKGPLFPAQFPDTITPKLPAGIGWNFRMIHDGYYRCEEAILMLVQPQSELPQKKEKTPLKPVQPGDTGKTASSATA